MVGRFIAPFSGSLPKTSSDEKHQAYHGHLAENSMVDNSTDACSLRCIFATFLAVPASAIHTMKARGNNDDDEDSDNSNNSNDKVWDEDEDDEQ